MSAFRETASVFKIRNYRLFWLGSLVSNIGRWFQTVAIPVVIFDLTDSAGWVGLAGFAQIMPMALVSSVGAVRWPTAISGGSCSSSPRRSKPWWRWG